MSENLKLWESLATTDKAYTKTVPQRGGFTDINPQWRFRRMTETFGPCGYGWGYNVISEGISEGIHWCRVDLWYLWEDKRAHVEHYGATQMGTLKDEAFKASLTDALGKCMSMIGLCADVYLGEFDSKYQAKPREVKVPSTPEDERRLKMLDWFKTKRVSMAKLKTFLGGTDPLKADTEQVKALAAAALNIQNGETIESALRPPELIDVQEQAKETF